MDNNIVFEIKKIDIIGGMTHYAIYTKQQEYKYLNIEVAYTLLGSTMIKIANIVNNKIGLTCLFTIT